MRPIEGRLQSAEHILAKTMEGKIDGLTVGISKFNEETGLLEISSKTDPRTLDLKAIEQEVNGVIGKNLRVNKTKMRREDAQREMDLKKVPLSVKELTIIDFEGFDKRPCRDPHVNNTGEIGHFKIMRLEKVGLDRYRFVFRVE